MMSVAGQVALASPAKITGFAEPALDLQAELLDGAVALQPIAGAARAHDVADLSPTQAERDLVLPRAELKTLIRKEFDDPHATYGYRRVRAALLRSGVPAGPELVRALMRELSLLPCQPRQYRPATTDADPAGAAASPDLVHRDFTADAPGQKMVGDITCRSGRPGSGERTERVGEQGLERELGGADERRVQVEGGQGEAYLRP